MEEESSSSMRSGAWRRPGRRFSPALLALVAVVTAYVVWILSLPAFPSFDGPSHLYYVHIMALKLAHHAEVYAPYFRMRHMHLPPPYVSYYLALILLSKALPLLLADKVVVCVYVVVFVFGFRYLAIAIGPSGEFATLLATAVVLNWSLGMGFLNFCVGLGLSFWTIGLWLRFRGRDDAQAARRRTLFVLLLVLMLFTHPVPLLLVPAWCGVDLLMRRLVASGREEMQVRPLDVVPLVCNLAMLGYVALFRAAVPQATSWAMPAGVGQVVHALHDHMWLCINGTYVSFLDGTGRSASLYRHGLFAVLLAGFGMALVQLVRNRRAGQVWTPGDSFLLCAVLVLLGLPAVPRVVNGVLFFGERLYLLLWVWPLLAAAGWEPSSAERRLMRTAPKLSPGIVGGACAVAVLGLTLLWLGRVDRLLRPYAVEMAAVEALPVPAPGMRGTFAGLDAWQLENADTNRRARARLTWFPREVAYLHALRHADAVWTTPWWMEDAIAPLKMTETFRRQTSPVIASIVQPGEGATVESVEAARQRLLAVNDFLVLNLDRLPGATEDAKLALLLGEARASGGWTCSPPDAYRWLICRSQASPAARRH